MVNFAANFHQFQSTLVVLIIWWDEMTKFYQKYFCTCDQSLYRFVDGTLFQSKNIIFVNQYFQSSRIKYILTLISIKIHNDHIHVSLCEFIHNPQRKLIYNSNFWKPGFMETCHGCGVLTRGEGTQWPRWPGYQTSVPKTTNSTVWRKVERHLIFLRFFCVR